MALVAGCSSTDTEPATEQTASTNEVTIAVTPTTTTVVDPGAEPRRVLAFDTADADAQNIDLTTTSTVQQQIDVGAAQDFSSPELTVPLSASTADAVPDDDASTGATRSIDLTIGAATSPDEGLTDALSASEGSTARLAATESGAITALHITPADAALDTARAAIERSFNAAVYRSVAFPDAEVGVGAVWTIDQQVLSGITLNQRTTVTLRALDGDRATVDIAITQTPESPVWNLPDNSGTLNIASYTYTGAGTLDIDLTQPLPVGGSITAGGDQMYTDPDSTTVLRQTVGDSITWGDR
ncbi:hypothetical protein CH254_05545 [Rhodococcus sp. 06-412-2C]|nr:hypothetical protein CH254_05545 [Rhodococcus sp. 06-412-2C]OZC92663.1 hypothetical protein CH279_26825 [Rhodococcus sp. 06-412-2B]